MEAHRYMHLYVTSSPDHALQCNYQIYVCTWAKTETSIYLHVYLISRRIII